MRMSDGSRDMRRGVRYLYFLLMIWQADGEITISIEIS